MAKIVRFKDIFKEGHPLNLNDLHTTQYKPGEDELTNYRAYRRKRLSSSGEGGPIGESAESEVDESLNISQRLARQRMFKRFKSKIKLGRERAKRKMANQSVLQRRAIKQARAMILKKITKGASKDELSFARRQDLEKRLEKPQMQKRIKLLSKRIYKDVRKREVERKKG
jgi:hypothetical protein